MRNDLKVPKRPTPVTLTLVDGSTAEVVVFLSEFSDTHAGPERVSDLLNAGERFFPARAADGRMAFFHCRNVVMARVASALEDETASRHTLPSEIDVALTLVSGARVQGFVSYVRPTESGRLVDHLNDPEPFLRLFDGDDALLVNKRLVLRVEPTGAP